MRESLQAPGCHVCVQGMWRAVSRITITVSTTSVEYVARVPVQACTHACMHVASVMYICRQLGARVYAVVPVAVCGWHRVRNTWKTVWGMLQMRAIV